LVGLRGWTIDGRFRERDTVTLLIGEGDRLVSAKAHVLAAGGSLMRIVRRDAAEETERRLAPRLRVDLPAAVTVNAGETGLTTYETEIVDLSSSGCAVRAEWPLAVGTPLAVDLTLGGAPMRIAGTVVRTWSAEGQPHAGVRFDPMPADTTRLLNRFLVDQLGGA
jgi:PilZ domain